MCSRRSSIPLTGRPSAIDAHGTRKSSGENSPPTPNPPPTSGSTNRMRASGRAGGSAKTRGGERGGLQRHAGVPLDREALADADVRIGQETHGVADDRRQMFGDVSR